MDKSNELSNLIFFVEKLKNKKFSKKLKSAQLTHKLITLQVVKTTNINFSRFKN